MQAIQQYNREGQPKDWETRSLFKLTPIEAGNDDGVEATEQGNTDNRPCQFGTKLFKISCKVLDYIRNSLILVKMED